MSYEEKLLGLVERGVLDSEEACKLFLPLPVSMTIISSNRVFRAYASGEITEEEAVLRLREIWRDQCH